MWLTSSDCSPSLLYWYPHSIVLVEGNILTSMRCFGAACYDDWDSWHSASKESLNALAGDGYVLQCPIPEDTRTIARHNLCLHFSLHDELFLSMTKWSFSLLFPSFIWVWGIFFVLWVSPLVPSSSWWTGAFGCTVSNDGVLNIISKYWEGAVAYCEYFVWTRDIGNEYIVGRYRDLSASDTSIFCGVSLV